MKKYLFVILACLLLLTGCGKREATGPMSDALPVHCVVGIRVGEEGYYSMFADATLTYYNGELTEIELDNPVLLAFSASENWDGGYYVYSYEEISSIIETLQQYDDPELHAIIEQLQRGLLMIEAST